MHTHANMLCKIGDVLTSHSDEIGTLLSREEGETQGEGIVETIRAVLT